ncbi:MAG: translation initiation factor [Bacteroidota bacterium]|mgnify:CR=1 FL=1|nr:translation initiation factor [Bacteroidota bacterium]MDX5427769.1 translation initiation factor [Bacteroidota bacterium]MDX5448983.1 translation initiation factor [Bacteroidota bacterium]MDX5505652.1 translation initiation factor [Bacteroidota bacterium]
MSKKKKIKRQDDGIVYSTNPNFAFADLLKDLHPDAGDGTDSQDVRVHLEKKGRGGKVVSIIKGFTMAEDEIDELARELKAHCGVGGSVKEGEVIIQGDQRDKIISFLKNKNILAKKAGG